MLWYLLAAAAGVVASILVNILTNKRRLQRAWLWSLLAGIASAATVGAIATFRASQSTSTDQVAPVATIVGDCSAIGTGITVDCSVHNPLKEESIAGLVTGPDIGQKEFYFLGNKHDLGTPPDYSPEEYWNHCESWLDWMEKKRFYTAFPQFLAMVESGTKETVSITNVRVQVIDRRPIGGSYVKVSCGHGAGSVVPGSFVDVDTRTGRATAGDATTYPSGRAMPPARIKLIDLDGETVLIKIKGEPGYAYAGFVEVQAVINGKPTRRLFGSSKRPFLWVQENTPGDSRESVDWDPTSKSWVKDLKPPDS